MRSVFRGRSLLLEMGQIRECRLSLMSTAQVKSTAPKERPLHPLPLRIMHWINAVAIFIMIGSGWKHLQRRSACSAGCIFPTIS